MSASNEWTEWHLTPRGWERGTEKEDFRRIDREPPTDRVLTTKWIEQQGHAYGNMHCDHQEIWRSENGDAVNNLVSVHGKSPRML